MEITSSTKPEDFKVYKVLVRAIGGELATAVLQACVKHSVSGNHSYRLGATCVMDLCGWDGSAQGHEFWVDTYLKIERDERHPL